MPRGLKQFDLRPGLEQVLLVGSRMANDAEKLHGQTAFAILGRDAIHVADHVGKAARESCCNAVLQPEPTDWRAVLYEAK